MYLSSAHDGQSDQGGLVDQRHAHDLCRFGCQQPGQPRLLRVILACHAKHGRSATYKEAPQVTITLLSDAAKPFLATETVRSWCQAQSGRELAA